MSWTGFGGSWQDGVHSGADDSDSNAAAIFVNGEWRIQITSPKVNIDVINAGNNAAGNGLSSLNQTPVLYNGQMGYWVTETRNTAEHEVTTKRFIAVGPSEAEKAAAADKSAQDKLHAEAAAREQSEKAAVEAKNAEDKRKQAIAEATIAGQFQSVTDAQQNLDNAISEANRLKSTADTASQQTLQKRSAAASGEVAATKAESVYQDIQTKTTGKAPNGKGYTINNGMIGYIIEETRNTAEHEVTTKRFISTGISVAQRDAARDDAVYKRATATQLSTEALSAESISASVAITAHDAETRSQAAQAALASAQQSEIKAAEAEQKEKEAERAAALAEEERLKAEAAAKVAEEARIAAENAKAMQARQAARDKLKSTEVQSVRGIPVQASMSSLPLGWAVASIGGITLGENLASTVWSHIAAAFAELRGLATASLAGPVGVTVMGLMYSEKVGVGSDIVPGRDISALMPGDAFSLPDNATLDRAADSNSLVSMPVRGRLVIHEDDTLETQLVRTPAVGGVAVARAVLDSVTGYWGYTLPTMPGIPSQTILVSPSDAPGLDGPLGLSGPVPLQESIVHTGGEVIEPDKLLTTVLPLADDFDFNDVILIFPTESGLKPLYVMLRDRRNMPGTGSGKGQQVGIDWLNAAATGDGAPIPSQIADKLHGRTFSTFDSFRHFFWKAVAEDIDLNKQFNPGNRAAMSKGYSPAVPKSERVGGRKKYELHHLIFISKDGAVYDVDNMRIITPKRHIDVHKGDK